MDGARWRHVVADLRSDYRCVLPTLPMGAHRQPMRSDADLSLRGMGRLLAEFLVRLDLDDVTLCFNDWCGAQVMIADGLMGRVGRLVFVSCEAFDNCPPGLPGWVAARSAEIPGGLAIMARAMRFRRLRLGRCDVRLVFLSALYLQLVLGYSPMEVGLAFLPGNLVMGAVSIGLSARLVMRFGIRAPLGVRLLFAALGLLLLARAPVDGTFATDVLPSMILLGLGAGMAFNPVLLAAMSDVEPNEAGLASGVVNTSFMMGGALGRSPGEPCSVPHGHAPRRWREPARGAHRRLPRRVLRRRDLRSGRRRARCVLTPHRDADAAPAREEAVGEPAPCSAFSVAEPGVPEHQLDSA